MSVTCLDILNLPGLKNIQVVAGKKHLNRIITWPYIGLADDMEDWVFGGELLFFTGIGLKKSKSRLIQLIQICDHKNLAGMVFLLSSYFQKIPEEVITYADSIGFPLFAIKSSETKLVEVTREIGNFIVTQQEEGSCQQEIVEKILFESNKEMPSFVSKAEYYGFDSKLPYVVAIIGMPGFWNYYKTIPNNERNSEESVKSFIFKVTRSFIHQYDPRTLMAERNSNLVCLIPVQTPSQEQQVQEHLREVSIRVQKYYNGLQPCVGIGDAREDISVLRDSFVEASRAQKVGNYLLHQAITRYEDIGAYRLLFCFRDLPGVQQYCAQELGDLVRSDRQHAALFQTLMAYCSNKYNLNKAAQTLFIHRNTLLYRLERIESIVGKKLDNYQDLFTLQVCAVIWSASKAIEQMDDEKR